MSKAKVDFDVIRTNLIERHQEGRLLTELPLMKSALLGFTKDTSRKATAEKVYAIALEISGIENKDVQVEDSIPMLQACITMMLGGGILANFGCRQPKDFYIDTRVPSSALNARKSDIYRAVLRLQEMAKAQEIEKLPAAPNFHNMGVL